MSRKWPRIPVAAGDDAGIVDCNELRARGEKHRAVTAPRPIVKGQEMSADEILRHLVVAWWGHEDFHPDDPDVRIPVELLEPLAIAVGGKRKWRKEQRRAIAERDARWQAEATQMRKVNPNLSDHAIAKAIAKREQTAGVRGVSARTIRRAIPKSKR